MTIQRIPGSPVAMSAFDLSSSIFAEGGEPIYYGSYQLYMSGVSDVHLRASCTPYLLTLDLRAQVPGTKSRGLRRKGLVRQLVHQVQLLRSPPASVA
jgi:hypothetical protein